MIYKRRFRPTSGMPAAALTAIQLELSDPITDSKTSVGPKRYVSPGATWLVSAPASPIRFGKRIQLSGIRPRVTIEGLSTLPFS